MLKFIATLTLASLTFTSFAEGDADTMTDKKAEKKAEKKDKKDHHRGHDHMNPDKNKDGVLSDEELNEAAAKLAKHYPKMKERFEKTLKQQEEKVDRIKKFLAMDANGDGQIDSAEQEALKSQIREKFAKMQEWKLKKFDTNKDGKLDESERVAMKKMWEDKKAAWMAKYDTNKDGKLSSEEKVKMREAMKKERMNRKKKSGFDKVYE